MQEQDPLRRLPVPVRGLARRALHRAVPALAFGLVAAACSSGGSAPPDPGATAGAASPTAVAGVSRSPSPVRTSGPTAADAATDDGAADDGGADDSGADDRAVLGAASSEPDPTASPTPTLPPGAIRLVRVANTDRQGANLRAEPSAASRRVKVVREAAEVELIGPDRQAEGWTWRNVQDEDGQSGWIPREFLVDERVSGPRPTPTPAPPTIQVTDITSPVGRGEVATITIVTRPGLRCEVRVLVFGPSTVPREGLEPKVANEQVECSWTWTVPTETVPGAWRYALAVGSGDQRVTREVSFGVR